MICTVDSVGLLLGAVKDVMPAAPQKSVIYQLEHILVEASSDGLQLAATDTELAISARIPAHVDAPGAVLVPARKLHDVLRALPSDLSCTIDATGERFVLATPIGRYKLPKLDASEFPELPRADHATTVTLAPADAKAVAAATVYAASTEQYRPAMTGVKFELGSNLIAVATDGYRLSTITIHLDSASSDILEAVVPARVVELLSKVRDDVVLGFSKTHVTIATGSIRVAARLIDESYPQWRNVIPKESPKVAVIERESLIKAIRRMALFTGTNVGLVRFHWEAGAVRLSATDPDTGAQAQEELACKYSSEPLDIGFNHKYITEALQHIPSDDVTLAFSAPDRAVIITPAEQQDVCITKLVMPMRTMR
jgi:DNA polymerase-3 subunit beta